MCYGEFQNNEHPSGSFSEGAIEAEADGDFAMGKMFTSIESCGISNLQEFSNSGDS